MTMTVRAMMVAVLLLAGLASAQEGTSVQGQVLRSPTRERPLRLRLGLVGGLSMQKTDIELAAGYDFAKLSERFRLAGDLTVGLRTTEISIIPMAGLRIPFELRAAPKLSPYAGGLAGFNLTFLRGSTALAIPVRFVLGGHYEVRDDLAVGLELGLEAGPLVAPFSAMYGAAHFGAVVAWGG
ncbi:MAG: hypothetical protein ACYC8T_21145 [Myxococcaceae bacterium]